MYVYVGMCFLFYFIVYVYQTYVYMKPQKFKRFEEIHLTDQRNLKDTRAMMVMRGYEDNAHEAHCHDDAEEVDKHNTIREVHDNGH